MVVNATCIYTTSNIVSRYVYIRGGDSDSLSSTGRSPSVFRRRRRVFQFDRELVYRKKKSHRPGSRIVSHQSAATCGPRAVNRASFSCNRPLNNTTGYSRLKLQTKKVFSLISLIKVWLNNTLQIFKCDINIFKILENNLIVKFCQNVKSKDRLKN